ncbi:hypothetical protein ABDK00_014100 [Niabella insulamsoli]|uniref:hypothetical protein n=1 Tax=Niabella insulamsoli TaxID=3144874 RepID=UPI0031FC61F2
MSNRWTQEDIDRFNAKKGNLPSKIPDTPSQNSGKTGNSARIPENPMFALGRMKAGKMNKTETLYAARLEALKHAGEVVWYLFEPMNLRLADKCFYKVDFLVMVKTGLLEVHEVKGGFITDDALVKIKTAAEIFPFRFIMAKLVKGEWEVREF